MLSQNMIYAGTKFIPLAMGEADGLANPEVLQPYILHISSVGHIVMPAYGHFKVSTIEHFDISTFQHFSISTFQR